MAANSFIPSDPYSVDDARGFLLHKWIRGTHNSAVYLWFKVKSLPLMYRWYQKKADVLGIAVLNISMSFSLYTSGNVLTSLNRHVAWLTLAY